MPNTPSYSSLFSCLYDEPKPVGSLGRGAHYSVFRAVEWRDIYLRPLQQANIHDFAVIWDEDHDRRIIQVIERIYMAGLFSPIRFVGERKGTLSVILDAEFNFEASKIEVSKLVTEIRTIAETAGDNDMWTVQFGAFDGSSESVERNRPAHLIGEAADRNRVVRYLKGIDALWNLGNSPYVPPQASTSE
jgi:hypothetical protein